MKLTDATIGKTITIINVDDCEYTNKLSVLGFVSGCKVCPLTIHDQTVIIDVKGCRYAMSKELVDHINVEE